MSEFKPSKINLNKINGGQRYNNGDGVGAEAINSAIEASAFAQAIATNQPNVENVGGNGTPSVSIETLENGTSRLKFENLKGAKILSTEFVRQDKNGGNVYKQTFDNGFTNEFTAPKGEKGIQGDKGDKGDTGEQGPVGPQGPKGADGTMTFADLTEEQKASLKGDKGEKGDKGDTGAKILSTEFVRQDTNGNVYKQTFDNGTTNEFTAPKGDKGEKGDKGDKGDKGEQGEKGDTGAKIVSTEFVRQDDNGGNVYKQTFDNGVTNEFTAPKGEKGIQGEKGDKGEQGIQGNGITDITADGILENGGHRYKVNFENDTSSSIIIPKGEDGTSIKVMSGVYETLDDLPVKFEAANVNDGYLVKDSNSYSGHSLYFKGEGGTDWTKVPNFGKGQKGDPGPAGSKIVSTEFVRQDDNGGNVYKQTFDNGVTSTFTAPIQPAIFSPIYRHIFRLSNVIDGDQTMVATVIIDTSKSEKFTYKTFREYLGSIRGSSFPAWEGYSVLGHNIINANIDGKGDDKSITVKGYRVYTKEGGELGIEYDIFTIYPKNDEDEAKTIAYNSLTRIGGPEGTPIDATLTVQGAPADANAVGMAINELIYNKSTTEEYSERTTANGTSIKDVSSARIANVVGQTQFSINLFNGIPKDSSAVHKVANSTFKITQPYRHYFNDLTLDGSGKTYTMCVRLTESLNIKQEEGLLQEFSFSFFNENKDYLYKTCNFDFSQQKVGEWQIQTYQIGENVKKLLLETRVIDNRIDSSKGSYSIIKVMLLEGEYTEDNLPPFEDYYEKYAHFKKFTSKSADGTEQSVVEFAEPIELPQGATIDFDKRKIIRETAEGIIEEDIPANITGKYIAYKGGTETIESGVEDSLPCTLEQFYIVSDVEANPTDEATEELITIKIGNKTYFIPIGSSGSGGTTVTVNGVAVETFNADTKADKWETDFGGYANLLMQNANGTYRTIRLSYNPLAYALVPYHAGGRIKTNAPTEDLDCVNLQTLNNALANAGGGGTQLYKHEFETNKLEDGSFNKVVMITTRSTAYTTASEVIQDMVSALSPTISIYRKYEFGEDIIDRCYGVGYTPYDDAGTTMLLYYDHDYSTHRYVPLTELVGTIETYAPTPLQGD